MQEICSFVHLSKKIISLCHKRVLYIKITEAKVPIPFCSSGYYLSTEEGVRWKKTAKVRIFRSLANKAFFKYFVFFIFAQKLITNAMKRFLFICLFAVAIFKMNAQPLCQIKHFTVNNGLAQGTVMNILQDQKGFIWFGTWNGLNKFDGYTFKNYKAFPGDGCTLTSNRLLSVQETKYGDIWCKTYDNKIYLFDSQTEKFIDILQPIESEIKQKSIVRAIYALKKGVCWIVCEKGYIFRVDEHLCKEGKGITLYGSFNKNLKGDKVYRIYEDSDGDEWILTDKGISIIGKKKIDSDFPFNTVKEINGTLFLTSNSGKMAYYQRENGKVKFIEFPFAIHHFYKMGSLSPTDNDSIYFGTDKGVLLYQHQKKSFELFDIRTPNQPSEKATNIYKDRQGEIWIFSDTPGITKLNLRTKEKKYFRTPEKEVVHYELKNQNLIYEDKEGTLWILPQQGNFSYYDRTTQQLKPLLLKANNLDSKFTPYVRYAFPDKQGNLWLTSTRGMERMSFFPVTYTLRELDKGLDSRSSYRDNRKQLWIASKAGYVRIYHPDGSLRGYLSPTGNISKTPVSFAKNVYCMKEDKKGAMWMGTKQDGLLRLTRKDENSFHISQFTHHPDNEYSLSNNSIYSICQDSRNHIWIGCYGGGLNLLHETPEGEIRFIHSGNQLKNYPASTSLKIRHITEVTNGVIMVGTTYGLVTFSNQFDQPEEIKFYRNIRVPDTASSLSSNDVMYMYTDSRQTTYVLTFTGGLNKVVSNNLLTDNIQFKAYTVKDGLISDLVLSMIEDKQKNLWIVSENALTRFDPEKETFDNYGSKFLQREINFSEAAPTLNGKQELVFGTDMGFVEIAPGQMKKSSYIPPIVFTGLKIQGKQKQIAIDDVKELSLAPSERNVTFQFAAIDYVNPDEICYAYRLKGLETQWNDADKNHSANYINLPPGEYELEVRSTNSDGVWVENTRTLPVRVLPTFWETSWAWLLYVVLFILFTATIVYILFYIYRLRHQVDMEQQLSDIKLRFFTDISHELRTPLTLISSPVTEVLEHESLSPTAREHLTLVRKNTERMLRLINQILDFRKIQNKKMKVLVEKTEIIGQLGKVMESFQLIAKEKRITFRLVTDQSKVYGWVDRDKFEKIVFNLLSNAFKYTPAGKSITVNVDRQDEHLILTVADEGIGIDPKKQKSLFQRFETLARYNMLQPSSGIGLSLVRELIELHHGTIEVESQPGIGSKFIVSLPLDRKIFEEDEQTEFILNDAPESNQAEAETKSDTDPYLNTPETDVTEETANNENALSILVVEDNKELRSFLRNILSDTFTVIEASNGQEGLDYTLQHLPDFIISDVMMPVMDGLDMVKSIKSNRNICHIPVILLSAKSSLDDRIAGLEQGIDDYITKPFSSTYLKTRIASLLQQRKQLQDIYRTQLSESSKSTETKTILSPSQPQITPFDEQFMEQVMAFMEEQMDNAELTIDEFADKLLLSRTVFYRKLKSIVGLTPVDFIREIRIKRAVQLIDSGEYNFSQVAYMTGFNDPKYFSKCFKKQIGITPTEYKEKKGEEKTN